MMSVIYIVVDDIIALISIPVKDFMKNIKLSYFPENKHNGMMVPWIH